MQQAISAGVLGLVIGYVAVQTGSIFPGMAFHATHNAAAVLLTSWVAENVVPDSRNGPDATALHDRHYCQALSSPDDCWFSRLRIRLL
jgi:hypothetical protein